MHFNGEHVTFKPLNELHLGTHCQQYQTCTGISLEHMTDTYMYHIEKKWQSPTHGCVFLANFTQLF